MPRLRFRKSDKCGEVPVDALRLFRMTRSKAVECNPVLWLDDAWHWSLWVCSNHRAVVRSRCVLALKPP